jgi:hypothetical protein
MFVPIPAFTFPDDYDYDQAEALKKKVDLKIFTLYINPSLLAGYNENDEGNTMIRLSNGEVWESPLSLKEFQKLLQEVSHIDLFYVEEN